MYKRQHILLKRCVESNPRGDGYVHCNTIIADLSQGMFHGAKYTHCLILHVHKMTEISATATHVKLLLINRPKHRKTQMKCAFAILLHLPDLAHIGGSHPGEHRQVPSAVLQVPPSHPSPHVSEHCTP